MSDAIHRHPDPSSVAAAAAEHLAEAARRAGAERGRFRLAISGGSTPRLLYEELASPALGVTLDWQRWDVFFSDERAVSPDHPQSNYRLAYDAWFSRVPLPASRIHRIEGELDPAEAAALYEAELGDQPFDLVLLGMGEDGHTASLFPGTPTLAERERRVVAATSPVPPLNRVTLTLRALNEARAVAFLVTGASKAERLAQVLVERAAPANSSALPASQVRPRSGAVHFYVDRAALPQVFEPA